MKAKGAGHAARTPSHRKKPCSYSQRTPSACRSARRAALLVLLVALAVLTPACADTEERGVFTSGSFKSDMTLIKAAKNRKAGPNHTVGPVPAGVAWDGEQAVVHWTHQGHTRACFRRQNAWLWVVINLKGTGSSMGPSQLYCD